MSLLGFDALGKLALTQLPGGASAPAILEDSWHQPWSQPVRMKDGLRPGNQLTLAFSPNPVVSFGWFEELSKPPVLTKPALPSRAQQFFAYQANPTTVTPFAWYANFSEPVRKKPGTQAARQQFFTTDTAVIPLSRLAEWVTALSEPVRLKIGLKPGLQQFYTGPPRLLPTSTIFGTLSALETKDIFLAGVAVFNPPASAEIGIVDTGFPLTEIGVAMPTVASVSISIQII